MGGLSGASQTISFLFCTVVTLADLPLVFVLCAATVRAYKNRQIDLRPMCLILAFVILVFVPPVAILWLLYLRS